MENLRRDTFLSLLERNFNEEQEVGGKIYFDVETRIQSAQIIRFYYNHFKHENNQNSHNKLESSFSECSRASFIFYSLKDEQTARFRSDDLILR